MLFYCLTDLKISFLNRIRLETLNSDLEVKGFEVSVLSINFNMLDQILSIKYSFCFQKAKRVQGNNDGCRLRFEKNLHQMFCLKVYI